MTTIKIDDKEYDTETMTEAAKNQLIHMQTIDMEINRLNMQLAIHQTARAAYGNALKQELENPGTIQMNGGKPN
jgi:hypothetical protein